MSNLVPEGEAFYGIQLPIQTLTQTLADPWEKEAGPNELISVAKAAESAGLDFVGVCDHVAIPDDKYSAHMTTTWYDPVATLSWIGANTERIHLLSVVWIAAYRHPLISASSFGTLSHLSSGRVILGLGAGHVEGEFKALNVDFSKRGSILDESIDVIRNAFTDEYSTHNGKHFQFQSVGVGPQPPGNDMPIWIGGAGPAAWRRVGTRGDGYIPMGNPSEQYKEIIETIQQTAADSGRQNTSFDIGIMPPWSYIGEVPEDLPPAGLTGSPEKIAEHLRADRDAGANVFHLKFRSRTLNEYIEQLSIFGEEVKHLL